ncbi:MAG TPA: cytochrome D1 domain-containing protein [Geobacteraceae bacterium]
MADKSIYKSFCRAIMCAAFFTPLVTGISLGASPTEGFSRGAEQSKLPAETGTNVHVQKGARIEFSVLNGVESSTPEVLEGEYAVVTFKITDATTGAPISALKPAAWLDLVKEEADPLKGANLTCNDKVKSYLRGSLGYRPDIDLNSYYILSMNNDASISVIDPILGVSGYTNLYAMIMLKRPGEDWVMGSDEKKIFVTMPKAGQVAVADTESFKLIDNIDAGNNPFRIVLQPDGKYLWVGNDAPQGNESGVTVIDVTTLKPVAQMPTGAGHHEIAFSPDSLYAFVTNAGDGTLSVIDTQQLKKLKELKTGGRPVAISASRLSNALYLINETDGAIVVVDAVKQEIIRRIPAKAGLRAIRFAPGDRWGFVANARENLVYVVDASTNSIAHTIEVGQEPDQISFSRSFAYVRLKGSRDINLIQLDSLGKEKSVVASTINIGTKSPGESSVGSTADAIIPTGESDTVLIANPADNVIYYYMEGMVAAMGSFTNAGKVPRAAAVVVRGLREKVKGEYSVKVRIPASGTYQVAFAIDSPWIVKCFDFTAKSNPFLAKAKEEGRYGMKFLTEERSIKVGKQFKLKFEFNTPGKKGGSATVQDIRTLVTLVPGTWSMFYPAQHLADGVYEVNLTVPKPGLYYLFFESPSLKLRYNQLPTLVLTAVEDKAIK